MLIKHTCNLLIIKMQGQGMSRETCCVVIYTKFLIHFSHCCLLRINPCMVQKIQINKNYLSNNMYCEVMLQFIFYVSQYFYFPLHQIISIQCTLQCTIPQNNGKTKINRNKNYNLMQIFLPFHWPRVHHVTCK